MDTKNFNLSGFNFSPYYWWKNIERSVSLTEIMAKKIKGDSFDFRKWLLDGTIKHDSLNLHLKELSGSESPDYLNMLSNDYYHEIIATSFTGDKIIAKSEEKLKSTLGVDMEVPFFYAFKIDSLNHFALLHFFKWIIFRSHFDWVRWHLFYDFIIEKSDEDLKGLYSYKWSLILKDVDFNHNFFEDVPHYKLFRDRLEKIFQESNVIEERFMEIRNSKRKPAKKSRK